MTRVFIADDHAMVRVGLRQVLTELGGFEVVGEADDGRKVLNAPELARCDVLVLDLSLPVIAGTEVLRRVCQTHPGLAVVVHSMHPEGQFRRRMLAAGAAAYVPKDAHPSELIAAVAAAGRASASVQVEPAVPHDPEAPTEEGLPHLRLTPREHDVFLLILLGRQVVDIAVELDVHPSTVSNHLAKVRTKLGVRTTQDLVHYAYAAGIVPRPPAT